MDKDLSLNESTPHLSDISTLPEVETQSKAEKLLDNMTLEDKKSLSIQDELIKAYSVKDLAALVDKYGQAAVDESIGLLRVEDFILDNATVEEKVSAGDTQGVNGDDPSSDGSSAEGTVDEELEAAIEEVQKQLKEIKWTGWVIKSAIEEETYLENRRLD